MISVDGGGGRVEGDWRGKAVEWCWLRSCAPARNGDAKHHSDINEYIRV